MTTCEDIKVTICDISGINLKGLNVYNMGLCTDPSDGANKSYVISKSSAFSNIGIGSQFYQGITDGKLSFRDISTNIFTVGTNRDNLYINTNLFYFPYPRYNKDNTSIPTPASYLSSILAQNGKIYFIPSTQTRILVLNPNTNVIDTTSIPVTSNLTNEWMSSILAPNGKIYCVPGTSTRVLIINPYDDSIDTTTISIPGLSTSVIKWTSSCITPKGLIYSVPFTETRVLIINTNANTYDLTSMTIPTGTNLSYSCCYYTPENKIFGCPGNTVTNRILLINLNNNSVDTTSMVVATGQAYASVSLSPNGNLYSPPAIVPTVGAKRVLIINPITNVVDTSSLVFQTSFSLNTSRYYGSVMCPDGILYCTPSGASNILLVNTNTNVPNTTNIVFSGGLPNVSYGRPTLAPNGKIFCPPYNTSNILIVNTDIPKINIRQCLCNIENGN